MNVLGPMTLEIGLGALMLVVLLTGIFRPATPDRRAGWVALLGLLTLVAVAFAATPGGTLFGGSYVVDALALFAKRLFLSLIHISEPTRPY